MRVKDLAAELISEIAEEHEYYVFRFEKVSPGCGFIVYETTFIDDESGSDEDITKYKVLSYEGPIVKFQSPGDPISHQGPYVYASNTTNPVQNDHEIDLHDPDSVQEIEAFFKDLKSTFDNAFGLGMPTNMFVGYSQVIGQSGHSHSLGGHNHSIQAGNPIPHAHPVQGGLSGGVYMSPPPTVYGSGYNIGVPNYNLTSTVTVGSKISYTGQAPP
jgi:hypothetical protein